MCMSPLPMQVNLLQRCIQLVCPMGCEHDGAPLHQHACMHSNHTPSFTISKLGSNKSIPLVDSVDTGSSSIGIQYDLGSQLSLISRSTLQELPPNMYTVGKTYHINLLPFTGEGSKVFATEVTLKLNRFKLQLYICNQRQVEQHFVVFNCNAKPAEGVHEARPTVPLH